jgi:hypothetical protein
MELKDLKAVFLAAKEDYEGGYITSIRALIQAERLLPLVPVTPPVAARA